MEPERARGRVLKPRLPALGALLAAVVGLTCSAHAPSPARYRLTSSGAHWDVAGADAVFDDLRPRYAEFFEVILNAEAMQDPDLRPLRRDLEQHPVDRRNYDALNAVAIAYFELNYRAESNRGNAFYLRHSFRAAKLLGVPWKAYGLVDDAGLRNAILDFFEDAASGEKLASAGTAPRLTAIVASLEAKEDAPERRERIRTLTQRLEALTPR